MVLDLPLVREYERLWSAMRVRPEKQRELDRVVRELSANRGRYEVVASEHRMPWQVVAAIHSMERSGRFDGHLHNGDPLTARTKKEPPGRPLTGEPPFTWEQSARDALVQKRARQRVSWDIAHTLHFIEGYNGWGYRLYHPRELSSYVWSMATFPAIRGVDADPSRGKYVTDGKFDPQAVSKQVGAALILKALGFARIQRVALEVQTGTAVEIRRGNAGEKVSTAIAVEEIKVGAFRPRGEVTMEGKAQIVRLVLLLLVRVFQAEAKFRGQGRGDEKKKWVLGEIKDLLAPFVAEQAPWWLPTTWAWNLVGPTVLGGGETIVQWLNNFFGPNWLPLFLGVDSSLTNLIERFTGEDVDGDGDVNDVIIPAK